MLDVAEHVTPSGQTVMRPRPFTVLRRRKETADTVTLTMAPADDRGFAVAPGQFTMLYAYGVGEVPISVSGQSQTSGGIEQTVRAVGAVTRAIVAASPGTTLGVRGPLGTGWGVDKAEGRDVVVIAGGIGLAPLRPVLRRVLADRERFSRVILLYGARTPEDLLFRRELAAWRSRRDVVVGVVVDQATPRWRGQVGLVTSLLTNAAFDAANTLAFLCGPEVMMRLTADALLDRGVGAECIELSLERNMQCGVGLCGHCQLREYIVCTDGPVFRYDEMRWQLAQREL